MRALARYLLSALSGIRSVCSAIMFAGRDGLVGSASDRHVVARRFTDGACKRNGPSPEHGWPMPRRSCSTRPASRSIELAAANDNAVKCKVTVAPECRSAFTRCGCERRAALATLLTFTVGPFAEVEEKEPNTEFTLRSRLR